LSITGWHPSGSYRYFYHFQFPRLVIGNIPMGLQPVSVPEHMADLHLTGALESEPHVFICSRKERDLCMLLCATLTNICKVSSAYYLNSDVELQLTWYQHIPLDQRLQTFQM
jgi:hypothetical protein